MGRAASLENYISNLKPSEEVDAPCALCGGEVDWRELRAGRKHCPRCIAAMGRAREWNAVHFQVPRRYQNLPPPRELPFGAGYLLFGTAGAGKTYRAFALLQHQFALDPRLRLAAYCWPDVLLELRLSYNQPTEAQEKARKIITALRQSDAVLLDDVGAEKITENNTGWLRETMYSILNERWAEERQTVLTSNLAEGRRTTFVLRGRSPSLGLEGDFQTGRGRWARSTQPRGQPGNRKGGQRGNQARDGERRRSQGHRRVGTAGAPDIQTGYVLWDATR